MLPFSVLKTEFKMKIKKKNDFNRMLNYLKAEILEKYTKEKRKQNCL